MRSNFVYNFVTVRGQATDSLQYGFGEIDFTGEEGVLEVSVVKIGTNEADYHLSVISLTYEAFANQVGVPPPELDIADRPDAAERKLSLYFRVLKGRSSRISVLL